jgi:AraC-like DNA-binding protein
LAFNHNHKSFSAMTISLSVADFWHLNTKIFPPPGILQPHDPAESFWATPSLNEGYGYYLELGAGIELSLWQETYFEDTEILCPTRSHPWVEFSILLEGSYRLDTGVTLKAGQSHLQGSGIAAGDREFYPKNKFCHCLNVHLDPAILSDFISRGTEPLPSLVQTLIKENDWQTVLSPQKVTPAMAAVTRQILNCPFQGFTQQMYLQSKIWELLALQLAVFLPESRSPSSQLKPQTIERIHAAKDILLARLEQPPTIAELARQVGVSDRTLQRGFQSLFGMTVFAYLTDRRMLQADLWLRSRRSVADVANLVGYSNPGHFAAAFKRRFGITPTACSLGKKSFSR